MQQQFIYHLYKQTATRIERKRQETSEAAETETSPLAMQ